MQAKDDALILFLAVSRCRMREQYLPKLEACLGALTDWQLWGGVSARQPIGSTVEHLVEHVARHAAWMADGEPPVVRRPLEEHFPRAGDAPPQLAERAHEVFRRWDAGMGAALRHVRAAGRLPDGGPELDAIYHLVEHVGYHLGQIVLLTTSVTGAVFAFTQHGLDESALAQAVADEMARPAYSSLVLPFVDVAPGVGEDE